MGRAARLCPAAASDLAVADPWEARMMMMMLSPRAESPRDSEEPGERPERKRPGAGPGQVAKEVIGGGRWKTAARHVQGEWRSVPAVQTGLEQFCSGRITCSMAGTGGLRLGHPSCDPAPGRPGKAGREGNRILSSICPAGRGVIILYLPLSAPPRCFAVPAWILGLDPRIHAGTCGCKRVAAASAAPGHSPIYGGGGPCEAWWRGRVPLTSVFEARSLF